MQNMQYFYKIFQCDERKNIAVPKAEAIKFLQNLQLINSMHGNRTYISEPEMISLLIERPGRLTIEQRLREMPASNEDTIEIVNLDDTISTLRDLREGQIRIGLIVSLMPRRALEPSASDPWSQALNPTHIQSLGPWTIGLSETGTTTPAGSHRSDPLTDQEAANIFNLVWAHIKSIESGSYTLDRLFGSSEASINIALGVEERNKPRTLFYLKLLGHHLRMAIPSLGHNCLPVSTSSMDHMDVLHDQYTAIAKNNFAMFFRYPLMFDHFERQFAQRLLALAKSKKQGKADPHQKIRILDIGVSTGEEALSLALICALVFARHQKQLGGKIGDWIEIAAQHNQDRFTDDIRRFYKQGCWPAEFLQEIPPKYLGPAKKLGLIIENGDSFSFSEELKSCIDMHYLSLFDPATFEFPILQTRYDMFFYIKVFDYLLTDPRSLIEASAAQAAIDLMDSGRLLLPKGLFYTEPSSLRIGWTQSQEANALKSARYAALRRSLPHGQNLLGPARTTDDNPLALFETGEIPFPIHADPLPIQSFRDLNLKYPENEVAVFEFTGRVFSPEQRQMLNLQSQIAELKGQLKKIRRIQGKGLTREGHIVAQREIGMISDKIGQIERVIRKLQKEGGKK